MISAVTVAAMIAVGMTTAGCATVGSPMPIGAAPIGSPAPTPPPAPRVAPPVTVSAIRYEAPRPGRLPANGEPTVAGIRLPPGHRGLGRVAMWETAGTTAEAVRLASKLAVAFPGTGLWPVLWEGSDEPSSYMGRGGDVAAIGREPVGKLTSGRTGCC